MVARLNNDIIDERLNDKFLKRIGNYLTNKIPIEIECIICGKRWETPLNGILNKEYGCSRCSGNEKLTNEIVDDRLKDRKIIRLGEVVSAIKNIKFKCGECDYIWNTLLYKVVTENHGCPQCSGRISLTNEIIDFRLKDRTIKRISDYSRKSMDWQCLVCNRIYSQKPDYILYFDKNCSRCEKSYFGEKSAYDVLKNNKFEFEYQYIIYDNGRKYIIDFYLPELNCFIEYNGRQHYENVIYYKGFDFDRQQKRDEDVKQYCVKRNINLFEIDARKYEKLISRADKSDYIKLLEIEILTNLTNLQ